MRRTSWVRILAAVVSIALMAVVWVAGAASASGSSLTLHAGRLYANYGHGVALTGGDTAQGLGIAHMSITVQASEFPFSSGFHTVAVGRTDASGRYRITVRPSHATRYRASVEGNPATSPTVTVYVVAKDQGSCNLCRLVNTRGTHTLIVGDVYEVPPGPIAFHGPEYFYYGQNNGSNAPPTTIRLVKTVPLRRIAGNALQGTVDYRVHFPAGPFRFAFLTCYKDAEAHDGLGLPGHHHCGDLTLTRAQYSGYVG